MVDTLGAVLQGLNNGAATGLDMYKTMREEERLKRNEAYRLSRDAINDARYEKSWERQAERDRVGDEQWNKTFTQTQANWQKTFDAGRDDAKYAREDAERRHQETMSLTRDRLDIAREKNRLSSQKLQAADFKKLGTDFTNTFDGSQEGFQRGIELVNGSLSHNAYATHVARQMGFNIPDEMVGTLRVFPAGEGRVMLGNVGADGKPVPYDPDGPDGDQSAVVMPAAQFATLLGGKNGAGSADAFAAVQDMRDATLAAANSAVGGQRVGVEQRRQGVATTLAGVDKQIAALKAEQANLTKSIETGDYQLAPEGASGTISNTAPKDDIEAAKRAEALKGQIDALEAQRTTAAGAMDDVRADSRSVRQGAADQRGALDKAWSTIEGLTGEKQATAARNFREAYAKDPALALRYPGMSLKEAGEAQQKGVNDAVDRLVSSMDSKTVFDAKGKLVSLRGAKANTRAALLSMPAEMVALTADYTGRTEGAMQKAVQDAQKAGKPQAIPYFLYSYSAGVDGKALVDLMGDEAMRGPKFNDKARFTYANRAVELMRDGKTSDPQAALGMAMQEQRVDAPKIGKGSTLADVMR